MHGLVSVKLSQLSWSIDHVFHNLYDPDLYDMSSLLLQLRCADLTLKICLNHWVYLQCIAHQSMNLQSLNNLHV